MVLSRSRLRELRRRRQERGVSVFIVVMVMALLTAVGIFTARATSLADLSAGYERQAVQTQYLAQYGMLATVATYGSDPQTYFDMMTKGLANPSLDSGQEQCRMNASIDRTLLPNPPCYKLKPEDIQGKTM